MKTTAKQRKPRRASSCTGPSRCSACGKRTAYCMAVSGSQGVGIDGRKWAMLIMRYNCTSCFTEVRRGVKAIESFARDTRTVIPIEMPNAEHGTRHLAQRK